MVLTEKAIFHIFGEDKTILVTGSKGSGKTNFAGVIMHTIVELGYKIWTNINFFKEDNVKLAIEKKKLSNKYGHIYIERHPNIITVRKLSEALKGMINSGPRGKALILDEAGIHAPSDRAVSTETKIIKDLNKVIRHFETCFILITQVKGSVPPDLREKDVDYHFRVKKNGKNHEVEIGVRNVEVDDEGEETITFPTKKIFNVPLSKYPIDGKFPTGFKIDIDLKNVLDKLSEAEDSIEIMDNGYGERVIAEETIEDEDKINYISTGKYARKYGFTTQTIWKWCNDGEVECYKTKGGRYRVLDQPPAKKDKEGKKINERSEKDNKKVEEN